MTATQALPVIRPTLIPAEPLLVEREGIVFYNVREDLVRIEVRVCNRGIAPTERTPLRLQAAPLGAFLPWTDLTSLWVPPLDGGEEITLTTEVSCPRTQPLGRFDQIPPERLITALGLFDDDEQDAADQSQLARPRARWSLRRRRSRGSAQPGAATALPQDLTALFGCPGAHWAGNINVLVGATAVERHRAEALRIYPGKANMAMLIVGNGLRDAYSFELRGDGAAWQTQLTAIVLERMFGPAKPSQTLKLGHLYEVAGMLVVQLLMYPPADAECGEVAVQVTRKSTGRTALVEFSLDAAAQGPGCYTV